MFCFTHVYMIPLWMIVHGGETLGGPTFLSFLYSFSFFLFLVFYGWACVSFLDFFRRLPFEV